MATPKRLACHGSEAGVDPAILDLAHLRQYTLSDNRLECELLNLFRGQLPVLVKQLEAAASDAEWKIAAHTLKGSARAIGATALAAAAVGLEAPEVLRQAKRKRVRIRALERLISRFEREISAILP